MQKDVGGYRSLEVYRRSLDALVRVHELAATLPDFETFDLASQLRRASKSIAANIAEGYAKRRSAREFVSFLTNAIGSANEVEVHLEIGCRLGYFTAEASELMRNEYDVIGRQLTSLVRSWSAPGYQRQATKNQSRRRATNDKRLETRDMVRITYELPDPAYEAYTWILQDEHMAGVPTHLSWEGGFFRPPRPQPGEVPMMVQVNGFPYARPQANNLNPFGQVEPPRTVEDLTRWRQEWLPQVDRLVRDLESFDPASVEAGQWSEALRGQDREAMRVFSGVHLNTVINGHMAVEAFTNAYVARFGKESRPETLQLLQGFANLSLERAAALWDLGRMAHADAAILTALEAGTEMPDSENGRLFGARFDELLRRFGFTTNIGGGHLPTWQEDRSIPVGMVKTYARLQDERDPRVGAEGQARARLALEAQLKAAEPPGSDLLRLLEMAQQYLPNLEDHNLLCDQRVGAAMRARWLATGTLLQGRGLESADDVFYYRRSELLAALDGGELLPPATIAERRAFIAAVTANPPPPRLGKPADDGPEEAQTRVEPVPAPVLRGVGAARGVYTGRARIIENLEDAGRLEEGDVLVCRMTSPPWTPLFATIGALVVNTGGMLSHGAVVAREFGIPAVVGTTYATTRIADGATVTVDGTNGVVTVSEG